MVVAYIWCLLGSWAYTHEFFELSNMFQYYGTFPHLKQTTFVSHCIWFFFTSGIQKKTIMVVKICFAWIIFWALILLRRLKQLEEKKSLFFRKYEFCFELWFNMVCYGPFHHCPSYTLLFSKKQLDIASSNLMWTCDPHNLNLTSLSLKHEPKHNLYVTCLCVVMQKT
jgi:hypothetical protein